MSYSRSDAVSNETMSQAIGKREGFWGRWLNLTAPPRDERTTASPQLREVLRKAELTGYCLFAMCCFCILDFILAFVRPATLIPNLIVTFCFALFLALITYFNRRGRTQLAALILIGSSIVSVMFVVGVAQRNSHATDLLPTFDFFVYPIIIGSLFIPRRWIWTFTIISIVFVAYDLLVLSHPPDIEQMKGTPTLFLWLLRPVMVIGVIGFISWLGARSVEQSILRADRAEELAAAERQVAKQAHMIAEQNTQLEAEMRQILQVHQEAAGGNYAVRVPVQTHGIIWQIGRSLNNLLARYEQFAREQREYETVKADIEQIAQHIERVRQGERPAYPPCRSLVGKRLLYAMGMPAPMTTSEPFPDPPAPSAESDSPSGSAWNTPPATVQEQHTSPGLRSPFKRRRPFDVWREQH